MVLSIALDPSMRSIARQASRRRTESGAGHEVIMSIAGHVSRAML